MNLTYFYLYDVTLTSPQWISLVQILLHSISGVYINASFIHKWGLIFTVNLIFWICSLKRFRFVSWLFQWLHMLRSCCSTFIHAQIWKHKIMQIRFTAFQFRSSFTSREDLLKHNHIFKAAGLQRSRKNSRLCIFTLWSYVFQKDTTEWKPLWCPKEFHMLEVLWLPLSKQWLMKSFRTFANL